MQTLPETPQAPPLFTLDEVRRLIHNPDQAYGAYQSGQLYFQQKRDGQPAIPPEHEAHGKLFRMYTGHKLREMLGDDWEQRIEASGLTHGLGAYQEDSPKRAGDKRYFLDLKRLDTFEQEALAYRAALRTQVEKLLAIGTPDTKPRSPELVIAERDFYRTHEELSQCTPLRAHLKSNGITFPDQIRAATGGRWQFDAEPDSDVKDEKCGSFKFILPLDQLRAFGESLEDGHALHNLARYLDGQNGADRHESAAAAAARGSRRF